MKIVKIVALGLSFWRLKNQRIKKYMNSKNNISKEEADKIMSAPGEIRGLAPKANWEYLIKERGPEVVPIIEENFARLGYPFLYKKISVLRFYSVGYDALLLLMFERIFNFKEENFVKMGAFGVSSSIIIKVVTKYFPSLRQAVLQTIKIWPKYYTIGRLEAIEISEEKRRVVLRVKNFTAPHRRSVCHGIRGYMAQIAKIVTKQEIRSSELKCMYEGDSYHEFLLEW